jgi:glycosyltransferase involved in cell wall biosynthesis
MENVSLIIPSYNRSKTLRRALRSIEAQTLKPDEVIVIDDGSTDDTRRVIKKEFPFVIYSFQENKGVSSARNHGIRKSRCEWLAFLDSDDEWLPGKLEKQVELIRKYSDMKVCHAEEVWIRDGKRVNAMKKHRKKGGWIFRHCLPLCAMSPSSIMIHRSVFAQTGLFDEELPACEDYDLWLRITSRFPVLFAEEPLINKYGGHDDQLSRKYWGMDRFRIQALIKIIDSGNLKKEDRLAAVEMLFSKLKILMQGAAKRGKKKEVLDYQELFDHYLTESQKWGTDSL